MNDTPKLHVYKMDGLSDRNGSAFCVIFVDSTNQQVGQVELMFVRTSDEVERTVGNVSLIKETWEYVYECQFVRDGVDREEMARMAALHVREALSLAPVRGRNK